MSPDPDAPSRSNPAIRECMHWVVVNIPGNHVDQGNEVAEYIGSGPPEGTGLVNNWNKENRQVFRPSSLRFPRVQTKRKS